jgi:thiamine biosynthesis lipoprotein
VKAPAGRDSRTPSLRRVDDYFVGTFTAMASPCELLLDTDDWDDARAALERVHDEAARIETTFSRYLEGNVVHRINHSAGRPVEVDAETASLIDYAATCWETSGGLFDITSGALRRVWKFDGGDRVPSPEAITETLRHVGWQRVTWSPPVLTLPAGMEIDLGGIGKEYAVDRAASLVAADTRAPFLVNFGGDLFASGARRRGATWSVGIDDPERTGAAALYRIDFDRGGLATSGDARRYVMLHGRRLGHILDPRTGWPVSGAPRSVTVLATTCVEAGTLSTLAYLQGAAAREFLEGQGVRFWIL